MRKLSLSILALLLAATTFAAPPQWVEGVASKDVNAAVAADPSAIHRGGALIVDHATLQTQLLPWSDGDSITLDFAGLGALTGCAETPVGWECDVDGSTWRAGVADLDGVKGLGKLSTALDDFTAPGAQSYVRIPIAEVPSTGEWRPIDKQLGGDWGDFNFVLQPELTAQEITDGATRPDWAVNSIAVYHKTKRNDRTGGEKYMTGKAAHLPAPVAVGFRSNLTTITGWTYGAWEIDTGTGLLTKVFDAAVIQGWSAQTATVVVDATLGYTTIGASNGASGRGNYVYLGQMSEDGALDDMNFRTFSSGGVGYEAIYTGTTAAAVGLVANSWSGAATISANNSWEVRIPGGVANLSTGDEVWLNFGGCTSTCQNKYDAAGAEYIIGTYPSTLATPDDPAGDSGAITYISSRRGSAYINYTPGSPPAPGGATPPGPLNLGLVLSL